MNTVNKHTNKILLIPCFKTVKSVNHFLLKRHYDEVKDPSSPTTEKKKKMDRSGKGRDSEREEDADVTASLAVILGHHPPSQHDRRTPRANSRKPSQRLHPKANKDPEMRPSEKTDG